MAKVINSYGTEQEFFDEYARRHAERFGETWEMDKRNPCY